MTPEEITELGYTPYVTGPTMTLHQMCEALRANCISCTENKMGEAIAAGVFPFAQATPGGPGRRRTYFIWTRDFYKWLDERMGRKAIRY